MSTLRKQETETISKQGQMQTTYILLLPLNPVISQQIPTPQYVIPYFQSHLKFYTKQYPTIIYLPRPEEIARQKVTYENNNGRHPRTPTNLEDITPQKHT